MGVSDISSATGLPVALDLTTGCLAFGAGTVSEPPATRSLGQLRPVLRDPAAAGPELVYRLYRGVRRREDEALLATAGLRYGSFRQRRGAAYYVLAQPDAEHGLRLEPNPAYGPVPNARVARGSRSAPVLTVDQPAYAQLPSAPSRFAFLDTPSGQDLLDLWRTSRTT